MKNMSLKICSYLSILAGMTLNSSSAMAGVQEQNWSFTPIKLINVPFKIFNFNLPIRSLHSLTKMGFGLIFFFLLIFNHMPYYLE